MCCLLPIVSLIFWRDQEHCSEGLLLSHWQELCGSLLLTQPMTKAVVATAGSQQPWVRTLRLGNCPGSHKAHGPRNPESASVSIDKGKGENGWQAIPRRRPCTAAGSDAQRRARSSSENKSILSSSKYWDECHFFCHFHSVLEVNKFHFFVCVKCPGTVFKYSSHVAPQPFFFPAKLPQSPHPFLMVSESFTEASHCTSSFSSASYKQLSFQGLSLESLSESPHGCYCCLPICM